jgi:cytochrome c-type biogenesis protein
MGVMSFFRKHRLAIQRIGGGILILLGILMATGVWGQWGTGLQYWFQNDVKLPI